MQIQDSLSLEPGFWNLDSGLPDMFVRRIALEKINTILTYS